MNVYTAGIWLYQSGLRIAAVFHAKARRWVQGRRNWPAVHRQLADRLPAGRRIWVHCASLGEFEQARPLIEALWEQPNRPVVLVSFFSPSGYEIRKGYAKADAVFYLPADLPGNARQLLDCWQPDLLVLVKYEVWLNLLAALRQRNIPAVMISARLRKGSRIFSGFLGNAYRLAYSGLQAVFTQDADTAGRLQALVPGARVIAGNDTRYDRVLQTQANWQPLAAVEDFVAGRPCVVCGSTWPAEEKMLLSEEIRTLLRQYSGCMILAPHEVDAAHLTTLMQGAGPGVVRYSQWAESPVLPLPDVLVIDNIGMLARLYAYAQVAYVGGAFGRGLHNILEAAVFGIPVIFGPKHHDFPEAAKLIAAGGAFSISTADDLKRLLGHLLANPAEARSAGNEAIALVKAHAGTTAEILRDLRDHGWIA